jgi:hypothetical protein
MSNMRKIGRRRNQVLYDVERALSLLRRVGSHGSVDLLAAMLAHDPQLYEDGAVAELHRFALEVAAVAERELVVRRGHSSVVPFRPRRVG